MSSGEHFLSLAAEQGFQAEALEKAVRLLELLEALSRHPFLKDRIALKGGTALNLFVLDTPRLSVDLDLNYIVSADRQTMLADKPKIEQAIQAVCGRLHIRVHRQPAEHAGGKWRLSYARPGGRSGTLEVDLNFLLRTPLWPRVLMDSRAFGTVAATGVPVLELHELAAGKLAALFSRQASRQIPGTWSASSCPCSAPTRHLSGPRCVPGAKTWRPSVAPCLRACCLCEPTRWNF